MWRTNFDDGEEHQQYNQIAWPTQPGAPSLLQGLSYTGHGGNFDFLPHVLQGLSKSQVSWRLSDH